MAIDRELMDRAVAMVDDLADVDLIETGGAIDAEIAYLRDKKTIVDAAVRRRMAEKQASIVPGPLFVAELVPAAKTYVWDVPKLSAEFRPFLAPAMWDEVLTIEPPKPPTPVYKVDTRKVQAIAKKLGKDAVEALEKCVTVEQGEPRLKYNPVAEEDRPL